jgi:predicted amidophosphoribosyltransferase
MGSMTDAAILAAKYGHTFAIMRWAATQLSVWPLAANATLIPVPSLLVRLQWRGYNQAEVIARELEGDLCCVLTPMP